jgi:ATP-dependent DNA helicase RecG
VFVQSIEELENLLVGLRAARGDHQWVEAKRARSAMPTDLWKSLSALANSGGGLVVLGVDEQRGVFAVTGVEDPAKTSADLQGLCSRAEPPLRPAISIIVHPDGAVVVGHISAVQRSQQPCHFPDHGSIQWSSFVRVGDGDVKLLPNEVEDMLAVRSPRDDSRRPAPAGAGFDNRALNTLFGRRSVSRGTALRRSGVVTDTDAPTLAGWLALGQHPGDVSPLGRVACMAQPRPGDPLESRQRGKHIEGTIGEILDGVLDWLDEQMGLVQVSRQGRLVDELDYPRAALREAISNALMHRSLSPSAESTSIAVRVTDAAVTITNPGGLHPGVDPRRLGLSPLSTPRNYALVHLCGQLTSPQGALLVEAQASGIARADRLCRDAGVAPLVFAVQPAMFSAIAIRGRLDLSRTANDWPSIGADADALRVVAFLDRLERLRSEDLSSVAYEVILDATTAARLLIPVLPEQTISLLEKLAAAHVLRLAPQFERLAWALADRTEPSAHKQPSVARTDAVAALLKAIAATDDGQLRPRDAQLGVADRAMRNAFKRAVDVGLIAATTDGLHDPNRAYRLTENGHRQLTRM